MYDIETLIESASHNSAYINGRYIAARPIYFNQGAFLQRLRDAWEVLKRRARGLLDSMPAQRRELIGPFGDPSNGYSPRGAV